ncbi:MAG TPA: site-2 protease family protein [Cyclobacteriaceae bacterium]|nr:site-2 protease family protein [Cyclobacteriaceae bacterium]
METTPRKILLHLALFVVTLVTTTMAGAEWVHAKSVFMPGYSWSDFASGFAYSLPFLLILTAHEFGHYFTAIHYRVRTTLPYYIPLPPLPLMFGTLGALIRLKSHVPSKQQNFDIGIAGPLVGFVVAIIVLLYGFMTLPPPEYIYQFHPEYETYGLDYAATVYQPGFMKEGMVDVILGKNLLFLFFEKVFEAGGRVPNAHELIHYPALFAGYLSLVFTSINLLPIGQLDGGHVLYGLVGFKRHRVIASAIFIAFLFYAGLGYIKFFGAQADPIWVMGAYFGFLYLCLLGLKLSWKDTLMIATAIFAVQFLIGAWWPTITGYSGWLLFAFIIGRLIGVPHPPCEIEEPLSRTRIILGWIALIVFIICFVPAPLDLIVATPATP